MIGPKVVLTGMLFLAVSASIAVLVKNSDLVTAESAYDKAVTLGACSVWVVIIGAVITIWEW